MTRVFGCRCHSNTSYTRRWIIEIESESESDCKFCLIQYIYCILYMYCTVHILYRTIYLQWTLVKFVLAIVQYTIRLKVRSHGGQAAGDIFNNWVQRRETVAMISMSVRQLQRLSPCERTFIVIFIRFTLLTRVLKLIWYFLITDNRLLWWLTAY